MSTVKVSFYLGRKNSLHAQLRRVFIAFFFSFIIVYLVSVFLLLLMIFMPGLEEFWGQKVQNIPNIPKDAYTLPLRIENVTLISVLLSAGIFIPGFKKVMARLDSFLFPLYDDRRLTPISCRTGIFKWYLPPNGPIKEAWDTLNTWLRRDQWDGRWALSWIWTAPRISKPFDWTIVCGPNGIGKTQLALEIARVLGQRHVLGNCDCASSWKVRLTQTAKHISYAIHRWLPFVRTIGDPWDTGRLLVNECFTTHGHIEEIGRWRPRKPTLLILDDPPVGASRDVIAALEDNKRYYWYPVRLVIVDQFITPDVPVEFAYDRWHHQGTVDPFDPVLLKPPPVDAEQFRKMLAGGFWQQTQREIRRADLPNLRQSSALKQLIDAVEGSPMLLALAVLWLAEDSNRTVYQLTQIESLEEEEKTLFPIETARVRSGVVEFRLIRERTQHLYGHWLEKDHGGDALRKTVAAAAIGDGISLDFAQRAYGLKIETGDLMKIFIKAPLGTVPPPEPWPIAQGFVLRVFRDIFQDETDKTLPFIGRVFDHKAEGMLKRMSRPGPVPSLIADALHEIQFPDNVTQQLACFQAMARFVLWRDPSRLDVALRFARSLKETELHKALEMLHKLSLSHEVSNVPDAVTHLALFAVLEARRLNAERPGGNDFLTSRSAMFKLIAPIHSLPVRGECYRELVESAIHEWIRSYISHLIASEQIESVLDLLLDISSVFLTLKVRAELQRLWPIHANVATVRISGIAQMVAVLCRFFAATLAINCEEVEATSEELSSLALHIGLSQPVSARVNARCGELLAYARSQMPEQRARTEEAAHQVDAIAAPLINDEQMQSLRVGAWSHVASARSQIPEQRARTEEAAHQVEAISAPFPNDEAIQLQRVAAWSHVASARSQIPEQRARTEEAAHQVEAISAPFPNDEAIQLQRAAAWSHVAYARSQMPEQRARTEEAAHQVEAIAAPLINDEKMQVLRAAAWSCVASARSQMPEQRARTEEAAHQVDAISALFPNDEAIQIRRVEAWSHVASARSQMTEHDNQS